MLVINPSFSLADVLWTQFDIFVPPNCPKETKDGNTFSTLAVLVTSSTGFGATIVSVGSFVGSVSPSVSTVKSPSPSEVTITSSVLSGLEAVAVTVLYTPPLSTSSCVRVYWVLQVSISPGIKYPDPLLSGSFGVSTIASATNCRVRLEMSSSF